MYVNRSAYIENSMALCSLSPSASSPETIMPDSKSEIKVVKTVRKREKEMGIKMRKTKTKKKIEKRKTKRKPYQYK